MTVESSSVTLIVVMTDTLTHPTAKTIAELDRILLPLLRNRWMNERDPREKRAHQKRLDEALDERLRLMKQRDINHPLS